MVWGVLEGGDKVKDWAEEGVGRSAVVSVGKGMVNHGTFRVCGNYCGPGWCNGHCNASDGTPMTWPDGGGVAPQRCEDACCMRHDKCCNKQLTEDRSECNGNASKCFQNSTCPSPHVLSDAFDDFRPSPKYCCGEKCPPGEDRKIWCGPKDAPVLCDTVE